MPDLGESDRRLAAALSAGTATARSRSELLAALIDARLFAAVAATATGEETAAVTGLRAESGAELAVLLIQAADGTRALPVFSDLRELQRWRPDARPVPLTGAQACAAATEEQATAVVLDPAGVAVVIDAHEIASLAAGRVPVAGTRLSSRHAEPALSEPAAPTPPGLLTALRSALQGERLLAARMLDGPDGPVLGVVPREPLDPAGLTALAHRISSRLGSALPATGLDLAQVPRRGPGRAVLGRRWFRRDGG